MTSAKKSQLPQADMTMVVDDATAAVRPLNNLDFSLVPGVAEPSRKTAKPRAEQAKLNEQLEWLRNRSEVSQKKKADAIDNRILQTSFPFWDDANRGVPNSFLRSGLFSVRNTEEREYVRLTVPSLSNYDIVYEGLDLQQDDLSVWMALVNMVRNQPMADAVYFSGFQLVKDLNWRMHSESYKRAKDSISRLKVTGVQIRAKDGSLGYSGSLVRAYKWVETKQKPGESTKWMVQFEPTIATLFMADTTTLLDWEMRKSIGPRATTCLWLHAFYATHKVPLDISVQKIHEMCRSADKLSSFKRTLIRALDMLVEKGFLTTYSINKNDLVSVTRKNQTRLVASAATSAGKRQARLKD